MINEIPNVEVATAAPGQTEFTFSFRVFEEDALYVSVDGTLAVLTPSPSTTGQYSLVTDVDSEGGTITFGAGMTGGERVILYRDLALERITGFPLTGPVSIERVNRELDRFMGIVQDLEEELGRTVRVGVGGSGLAIDTAGASDGDILMWNSAISNFELVQLTVGGSSVTITYDALVTVSETAPASPVNGKMWWKSDEGRMKIYYEDGDTGQWVDTSPVPEAVTRYTDAEARAAVAVAPSTETGTTYTLDLDDAYQYIRFTNAAGCAITVPPNSAVAFPIGTTITMRGAGAVVCSLVAGSGVSLNRVGGAAGSLNFAEEGATVQIKKVATDEWDIIGGMEV